MNYIRRINKRCRIVRMTHNRYSFILEYKIINKHSFFSRWVSVCEVEGRHWSDDIERELFEKRRHIKKVRHADKQF